MKSNLTKVSLALLSAAFFLGCQEQGPTALEIQPPLLAHISSELTWTLEHTGDVTTLAPVTGTPGPGKKSHQINIRGANNIILSGLLLTGLDPDGECFSTPPFRFSGALRPVKKDPTKVTAQYFFGAKGTDEMTDFKYLLELTGTVTGVAFPPGSGVTTVTWTAAEMFTEGRGKGSKKDGGLACVGTVTVNGGVTITGV